MAMSSKGVSRKRQREESVDAKPFQPMLTGQRFESLGKGIVKAVAIRKNYGIRVRLKPWDLCQIGGCPEPTHSTQKEKDLDCRYCTRHMPASVALLKDHIRKGKFRHGRCFSDLRAKSCFSGLRDRPCVSVSLSPCRCRLGMAYDLQHDDGRCIARHVLMCTGERYLSLRFANFIYSMSDEKKRRTCLYTEAKCNRYTVKRSFLYGLHKAPAPW